MMLNKQAWCRLGTGGSSLKPGFGDVEVIRVRRPVLVFLHIVHGTHNLQYGLPLLRALLRIHDPLHASHTLQAQKASTKYTT